jgi:hypothetical protein
MAAQDKRIQIIDKLLSEANRIQKTKYQYGKRVYVNRNHFITWATKASQFLKDNFDSKKAYASDYIKRFHAVAEKGINRTRPYKDDLSLASSILYDLKNYILENPDSSKIESIDQTEILCNRFHTVAKQLRSRRENRPTLIIEDEYDVQDLLYALLRIYFFDIRPEEWTPSYAGGSSRMDFLLKNEKIVIEVKKTRENLKERDLGEQLLIDIAKYEQHPDCSTLICFVYDPEERIENHAGLEADLMNKSTDDLLVKVFIRPTGN